MFGKIRISGKIEVVTGMHIGGSSQFAAIGAVDSPVVRDAYTDKPMIPGSSFKGKMRTLLAKRYSKDGLTGKHENDPAIILRLFGAPAEKIKDIPEKDRQTRLIFSDMFLINEKELKAMGIDSVTEVKFENTINRLTAIANPRQIERTIRGTQFDLDLIYNVIEADEIEEDFQAIGEGLKLLEYDYLGGSGSRGYGKIKISALKAEAVVGEIDAGILDSCNAILKEV